MIQEHAKPSDDFIAPYYAYTEQSGVSVPANSYINKTLRFSNGVNWGTMIITSEFQQAGAMTNISPVNATGGYITVVNHTSSAISGVLGVRALLSGNVTMSIS